MWRYRVHGPFSPVKTGLPAGSPARPKRRPAAGKAPSSGIQLCAWVRPPFWNGGPLWEREGGIGPFPGRGRAGPVGNPRPPAGGLGIVLAQALPAGPAGGVGALVAGLQKGHHPPDGDQAGAAGADKGQGHAGKWQHVCGAVNIQRRLEHQHTRRGAGRDGEKGGAASGHVAAGIENPQHKGQQHHQAQQQALFLAQQAKTKSLSAGTLPISLLPRPRPNRPPLAR